MPVLKPICELADETHKKQLVGTLYYNYSRGPKLVYLIRKEDWFDIGNRVSLKYKPCTISGIGNSVIKSMYVGIAKSNVIVYSPHHSWCVDASKDSRINYLFITKKA